MFVKLCGIEIKNQLKSITFYVFVILTALFVLDQMEEEWKRYPSPPTTPEQLDQKQSDNMMPAYGIKPINDPEEIRKAVIGLLSNAVNSKTMMVTIGFINKTEALSDSQVQLIRGALEKISVEKVSPEEFEKIINDLDEALGGNTIFTAERRGGWIGSITKTYDEALDDYNRLVKLRFTPAAAQLFADYYGISLGMMAVFLAAFVFHCDKRSCINELVCSRPVSGFTYVLSKYTGVCISIFASILAVAIIPTVAAVKMKMAGFNVDIFTYFYTFAIWLFPTVMCITAVAMFISLVFDNPIPAFAVQFVLFAVSVMPLQGDYSLYKVLIRHNSMKLLANPEVFYINRLFITAVSIALASMTAWFWEMRRRRAGERIK